MAPAFTIGLVRPSGPSVTGSTALNAIPVALTPISRLASSGPTASQTRAKVNGLATLIRANGTSASPAARTPPLVETTQIPNREGSTVASAGYTWAFTPSVTGASRAWTLPMMRAIWSRGGRLPVETVGAGGASTTGSVWPILAGGRFFSTGGTPGGSQGESSRPGR